MFTVLPVTGCSLSVCLQHWRLCLLAGFILFPDDWTDKTSNWNVLFSLVELNTNAPQMWKLNQKQNHYQLTADVEKLTALFQSWNSWTGSLFLCVMTPKSESWIIYFSIFAMSLISIWNLSCWLQFSSHFLWEDSSQVQTLTSIISQVDLCQSYTIRASLAH